ncbi:MAG TPA: EVE domain-containing protein [Patescibacteria group bacterium]
MNYFLAKTDPETYSIDQFEKDREIIWSGVKNPQAIQFLKKMEKGDRVFIYHSQGEAAIVGLAEVAGNSRPDPEDKKSWLIDFIFLKKYSQPYITLQDIKKTEKFSDFRLVKQSRLSVMDIPQDVLKFFKEKGLEF